MANPIICDNGEHRAMSDAEFVAWKANGEEVARQAAAKVAAIEAAAAAKASARAKLAALGLSEAEVSALLGA